MKALTIDPEFAMAIFDEKKSIECRTWKTNHRGKLLICAGAKKLPGFISGHALCTAELTDIEPFNESHLEGAMMDILPDVPCYAWHLENVEVVKPFPVRGKMGIFDVDDAQIEVFGADDASYAMTDDEFDLYYQKFYMAYVFPLVYMPGEHSDTYLRCLELGKEFREHPEKMLDGEPLPEEFSAAMD